MICVEWWCFEAVILLAGRLPQPEVAIDVVGICVNVATTTFMIPFGLSGQPVYKPEAPFVFMMHMRESHYDTSPAWTVDM